MKLIKAIIKPEKAVSLKDLLQEQGFHGITSKNSNGYGERKVTVKQVYRGRVYEGRADAVRRAELELVVSDDKVDNVIDTIRSTVVSGKGGDGRIYVYPLDDSIHIGTGDKHLGDKQEDLSDV